MYEYARKGQVVSVEPRKITLYHLELQKVDEIEATITFLVSCSKGTYIRTVCEDLASRLGTVGTMVQLVRTRVGEFSLADSVSMDLIKQDEENAYGLIEKHLIGVEEFFEDKGKISLDEKQRKMFENGVKLEFSLVDGIYRIYQGEQFVGIGEVRGNWLKREIVLV